MRDRPRRNPDDPTLPLVVEDAPAGLPRHLGPMHPRLAAGPFNSADHLFEVKWDGVRALVAKDERGLRVVDRNGADLLARLPELASLGRHLPDGVLLDGEVVVCDAKGRPRYELLAGRLGPKGAKRGHGPLFLAFDLLYDAYRPLLARPLLERRERLARLASGGPLLVPEHLEFDGEPFFEAVREIGLEGVVAKRRDGAYVPGARSADWLKIAATGRRDVVVCGAILADEQPKAIQCGAYRDEALVYVGTAEVPRYLRAHVLERIAGRELTTSPFGGLVDMPSGLRWLRPELTAIVEHGGPGADLGRGARFRSFRVDLTPAECHVEEPIRMPSTTPRLESARPRLVVLKSLFGSESAPRSTEARTD